MDTYDRYREKRDGCGWAAVTAIVFALLFLLGCLLLPGCASTKSLEQVNMRDSTVINYHDSVVIRYSDSIRIIEQKVVVNDSANLIIQFGQGGGTYNAKTGEATNVTGVQQTDTHHEQRDSTAYYKSMYEAAVKTAYDLQAELTDYKYELEKERKGSNGWNRFCSWWFIITAILLLVKIAVWVMEKNPTTAQWVAIVRKFVPFL